MMRGERVERQFEDEHFERSRGGGRPSAGETVAAAHISGDHLSEKWWEGAALAATAMPAYGIQTRSSMPFNFFLRRRRPDLAEWPGRVRKGTIRALIRRAAFVSRLFLRNAPPHQPHHGLLSPTMDN